MLTIIALISAKINLQITIDLPILTVSAILNLYYIWYQMRHIPTSSLNTIFIKLNICICLCAMIFTHYECTCHSLGGFCLHYACLYHSKYNNTQIKYCLLF